MDSSRTQILAFNATVVASIQSAETATEVAVSGACRVLASRRGGFQCGLGQSSQGDVVLWEVDGGWAHSAPWFLRSADCDSRLGQPTSGRVCYGSALEAYGKRVLPYPQSSF